MCLWIVTACIGLLPTCPTCTTCTNNVAPQPIMVPTAPPTTTPAPTTTRPPAPAPTPAPVTTLCTNPNIVCTANYGVQTAYGTLQGPPITGYSSQIPNYDSAVKFPRSRRSVTNPYTSIKYFLSHGDVENSVHRRQKRQACVCVAAGTCPGASAAAGLIDFRIVTPGGTSCPTGHVYCCTAAQPTIGCGTLQTVPATPAVTPATGQASFGEYPWQAMILTKDNDYIGGGVLIDQRNVLTVTHRMIPYIVSGTAPNVKVRLGEWDAAGTYEPVAFQEYTVQKVFSHPSFNAATLQYDITVLRLSAPVPLSPMAGAATTINRACLPPSSTSVYTGQRCWVSGWGKDMFGLQSQYQQILKEVNVPIVAPATCQSQLQTARLGATYLLDTTSFICAGGEADMDSCTGDGGSGLVCSVNGQWVVVGLVSWGLGCAAANVPAAYVNVAALLPWIQQQVATA